LFTGATLEPPEPALRAAAAAAGLAAVVVIGDCELAAQDLARLLGTFPKCVFLLTSRRRSLYHSGSAHEIGPIDRDEAVKLIAREIGREPAGLQRLQVAEACQMAAGQAQRLLQYAAFVRLAGTRPGQDMLSWVPPPVQAKVLALGLSESARRVLAALATFGTELAPDYFAAMTGLPGQAAAWPGLAEAGAELLDAALVTRAGVAGDGARQSGATSSGSVAYRITPDASAAVDSLGWQPAETQLIARRLAQMLAGDGDGATAAGPPPPNPALLLIMATMLHDEGRDAQASGFIRAVMPVALRAGAIQVWLRLARLGLRSAGAAGAESDLDYFLREDATWRSAHSDKPIATTAAATAPERPG
jgi:hypothetical protein